MAFSRTSGLANAHVHLVAGALRATGHRPIAHVTRGVPDSPDSYIATQDSHCAGGPHTASTSAPTGTSSSSNGCAGTNEGHMNGAVRGPGAQSSAQPTAGVHNHAQQHCAATHIVLHPLVVPAATSCKTSAQPRPARHSTTPMPLALLLSAPPTQPLLRLFQLLRQPAVSVATSTPRCTLSPSFGNVAMWSGPHLFHTGSQQLLQAVVPQVSGDHRHLVAAMETVIALSRQRHQHNSLQLQRAVELLTMSDWTHLAKCPPELTVAVVDQISALDEAAPGTEPLLAKLGHVLQEASSQHPGLPFTVMLQAAEIYSSLDRPSHPLLRAMAYYLHARPSLCSLPDVRRVLQLAADTDYLDARLMEAAADCLYAHQHSLQLDDIIHVSAQYGRLLYSHPALFQMLCDKAVDFRAQLSPGQVVHLIRSCAYVGHKHEPLLALAAEQLCQHLTRPTSKEDGTLSLAISATHALYMLQYPHPALRDALAQVVIRSLRRPLSQQNPKLLTQLTYELAQLSSTPHRVLANKAAETATQLLLSQQQGHTHPRLARRRSAADPRWWPQLLHSVVSLHAGGGTGSVEPGQHGAAAPTGFVQRQDGRVHVSSGQGSGTARSSGSVPLSNLFAAVESVVSDMRERLSLGEAGYILHAIARTSGAERAHPALLHRCLDDIRHQVDRQKVEPPELQAVDRHMAELQQRVYNMQYSLQEPEVLPLPAASADHTSPTSLQLQPPAATSRPGTPVQHSSCEAVPAEEPPATEQLGANTAGAELSRDSGELPNSTGSAANHTPHGPDVPRTSLATDKTHTPAAAASHAAVQAPAPAQDPDLHEAESMADTFSLQAQTSTSGCSGDGAGQSVRGQRQGLGKQLYEVMNVTKGLALLSREHRPVALCDEVTEQLGRLVDMQHYVELEDDAHVMLLAGGDPSYARVIAGAGRRLGASTATPWHHRESWVVDIAQALAELQPRGTPPALPAREATSALLYWIGKDRPFFSLATLEHQQRTLLLSACIKLGAGTHPVVARLQPTPALTPLAPPTAPLSLPRGTALQAAEPEPVPNTGNASQVKGGEVTDSGGPKAAADSVVQTREPMLGDLAASPKGSGQQHLEEQQELSANDRVALITALAESGLTSQLRGAVHASADALRTACNRWQLSTLQVVQLAEALAQGRVNCDLKLLESISVRFAKSWRDVTMQTLSHCVATLARRRTQTLLAILPGSQLSMADMQHARMDHVIQTLHHTMLPRAAVFLGHSPYSDDSRKLVAAHHAQWLPAMPTYPATQNSPAAGQGPTWGAVLASPANTAEVLVALHTALAALSLARPGVGALQLDPQSLSYEDLERVCQGQGRGPGATTDTRLLNAWGQGLLESCTFQLQQRMTPDSITHHDRQAVFRQGSDYVQAGSGPDKAMPLTVPQLCLTVCSTGQLLQSPATLRQLPQLEAATVQLAATAVSQLVTQLREWQHAGRDTSAYTEPLAQAFLAMARGTHIEASTTLELDATRRRQRTQSADVQTAGTVRLSSFKALSHELVNHAQQYTLGALPTAVLLDMITALSSQPGVHDSGLSTQVLLEVCARVPAADATTSMQQITISHLCADTLSPTQDEKQTVGQGVLTAASALRTARSQSGSSPTPFTPAQALAAAGSLQLRGVDVTPLLHLLHGTCQLTYPSSTPVQPAGVGQAAVGVATLSSEQQAEVDMCLHTRDVMSRRELPWWATQVLTGLSALAQCRSAPPSAHSEGTADTPPPAWVTVSQSGVDMRVVASLRYHLGHMNAGDTLRVWRALHGLGQRDAGLAVQVVEACRMHQECCPVTLRAGAALPVQECLPAFEAVADVISALDQGSPQQVVLHTALRHLVHELVLHAWALPLSELHQLQSTLQQSSSSLTPAKTEALGNAMPAPTREKIAPGRKGSVSPAKPGSRPQVLITLPQAVDVLRVVQQIRKLQADTTVPSSQSMADDPAFRLVVSEQEQASIWRAATPQRQQQDIQHDLQRRRQDSVRNKLFDAFQEAAAAPGPAAPSTEQRSPGGDGPVSQPRDMHGSRPTMADRQTPLVDLQWCVHTLTQLPSAHRPVLLLAVSELLAGSSSLSSQLPHGALSLLIQVICGLPDIHKPLPQTLGKPKVFKSEKVTMHALGHVLPALALHLPPGCLSATSTSSQSPVQLRAKGGLPDVAVLQQHGPWLQSWLSNELQHQAQQLQKKANSASHSAQPLQQYSAAHVVSAVCAARYLGLRQEADRLAAAALHLSQKVGQGHVVPWLSAEQHMALSSQA